MSLSDIDGLKSRSLGDAVEEEILLTANVSPVVSSRVVDVSSKITTLAILGVIESEGLVEVVDIELGCSCSGSLNVSEENNS